MKQTQSRGLKWVSLLLLAAILTTTTPFSAAAENVHTALSDGDTLSAAAQAPAEDSAPLPHPDPAETETEQKETAAISESPDLSSLLFRLNEYDTFTAEEKSAVRSFFGMENDEEQMRLAASQETNIQAALDALSEPRRTEAKIANMAEKGKSFAGLTISERSVITEYLRRSADELAPVFSALEAQGYDLFACTLIAQITEDGLFTLSEAVTLYQMYDGRIERDQNLLAFRSFAKAFTTAEDTLLSKDKTSALRTEKQAAPRKQSRLHQRRGFKGGQTAFAKRLYCVRDSRGLFRSRRLRPGSGRPDPIQSICPAGRRGTGAAENVSRRA